MKKIDLHGKNIEELKKDLKDESRALFDLRVENSLGKLKNGRTIFFKRKDIARIKTELTSKESLNAG